VTFRRELRMHVWTGYFPSILGYISRTKAHSGVVSSEAGSC
jgi:hypothetical protein